MPQPAPYPTDALALISITGADASAFLQGQLCSDAAALTDGEAGLTGYCNPKGRLLANGVLLRETLTQFSLALPAERAAVIIKRLQMFVMRSEVTLAIDERPLAIGNYENGIAIGMTDLTLSLGAAAETPELDRLARINAGVGLICDATAEKFLPQMLNMEALGGLSFKKGCFPGQEVVARTHYLGKLKQQLTSLSLNKTEVPGAVVNDAVVIEAAASSDELTQALVVNRQPG